MFEVAVLLWIILNLKKKNYICVNDKFYLILLTDIETIYILVTSKLSF